MVNLNDLWIGDKVILIKSKRVGTFEGKNQYGKARIDCDGKIILSNASNLLEYQAPPEKEDLSWINSKQDNSPFLFNDTLDLHFEKLQPGMDRDQVSNILSIQIKACNSFLEGAKSNGIEYVTIIHGKGEGILKNEILSLVNRDDDIVWHQEINDGGAIQIKLQKQN